jgi:hypothetical protein
MMKLGCTTDALLVNILCAGMSIDHAARVDYAVMHHEPHVLLQMHGTANSARNKASV